MQKGESRNDLSNPHHRQAVELGVQLHALVPHSLATDADEPAPRPLGLQGRDEACGMLITGGFAGEYHDRRFRVSPGSVRIRHVGGR